MNIIAAQNNQATEIFSLLCRCKEKLDQQHLFQWTSLYPALSIVEADIKNGELYCALSENRCAGIVTINEIQDPEYAAVHWQDNRGLVMVIHRLAVDPVYEGRGIAKRLMDFAEQYGTDNNYNSVRLDAFSENKRVLRFYESRGYENRGTIFFPGRTSPFFCYEKILRSV